MDIYACRRLNYLLRHGFIIEHSVRIYYSVFVLLYVVCEHPCAVRRRSDLYFKISNLKYTV